LLGSSGIDTDDEGQLPLHNRNTVASVYFRPNPQLLVFSGLFYASEPAGGALQFCPDPSAGERERDAPSPNNITSVVGQARREGGVKG